MKLAVVALLFSTYAQAAVVKFKSAVTVDHASQIYLFDRTEAVVKVQPHKYETGARWGEDGRLHSAKWEVFIPCEILMGQYVGEKCGQNSQDGEAHFEIFDEDGTMPRFEREMRGYADAYEQDVNLPAFAEKVLTAVDRETPFRFMQEYENPIYRFSYTGSNEYALFIPLSEIAVDSASGQRRLLSEILAEASPELNQPLFKLTDGNEFNMWQFPAAAFNNDGLSRMRVCTQASVDRFHQEYPKGEEYEAQEHASCLEVIFTLGRQNFSATVRLLVPEFRGRETFNYYSVLWPSKGRFNYGYYGEDGQAVYDFISGKKVWESAQTTGEVAIRMEDSDFSDELLIQTGFQSYQQDGEVYYKGTRIYNLAAGAKQSQLVYQNPEIEETDRWSRPTRNSAVWHDKLLANLLTGETVKVPAEKYEFFATLVTDAGEEYVIASEPYDRFQIYDVKGSRWVEDPAALGLNVGDLVAVRWMQTGPSQPRAVHGIYKIEGFEGRVIQADWTHSN